MLERATIVNLVLLGSAAAVCGGGCTGDGREATGASSSAANSGGAACTAITSAGQELTDTQGNVWTMAGGVVLENGSDAGYSANVVKLVDAAGVVYQENAAGGWWGWSGGTWVSASDPTGGCSAIASPSSSCALVTGGGQAIVDSKGDTWTISGGVVLVNGSDAGYSANVVELAYVGGEVYQENAAGGWWGWSGGTWVSASDPAGTCPGAGTSPNCTVVTGGGQQITDAQGNAWTIADGVVQENGSNAGYSANVVELAYANGEVYQENAAGGWWGWSGGTWVSASNPTANDCAAQGGGGGRFHVSGGQILGPDGKPFVARGIDVDQSIPGPQVTALFPGINFVRMPSGPGTSVSDLVTEATSFTDLGIVVEIEDHPWPEVAPYTGSQLTTETDWYASLATAFLGNPYVWFGTMNEPQTAYGSAEAAISTQEAAIYAAIRGTGSQTVILMELMGGGNPGTVGAGFGMTPSTYATMNNIVWDLHFYGWSADYSTDQATVNAALLGSASSGSGILAAQTIQSADGLVPVLIGEYGNSTDGVTIDANAAQVITAVETSGHGCAAWEDSPSTGGADILVSGGALTSYGQTVAAFIAGQ